MASRMRWILLSLVLLLTASLAMAQAWPPPAAPDPVPAWGTTDETALLVGSFEMIPYENGAVIGTLFGTGKRYVASATASPTGILPLELPRGAMITRMEAVACNDSAAGQVDLYLFDFTVDFPASPGVISIPASAGCGTFTSGAMTTVFGNTGPWGLLWAQSAVGATQRLSLVRVFYKLQVAPAPETATFADVPVGSALHQYVEALVAAGITAGCGGGNFCPGAAVTRGQIAVFLAKALGLHWAP